MTKKTVQQRGDAEMRRRLLERSGELRADIQRELSKYDDEHYNALADSVADSGDQSVADLLVDVDLAEITRDVEEIRDIEAALSRMAHGVYGVCVDCAAQIDRERLHYAPSAARCVPCQQRYEQKSREKKHLTL
ncbi:MAG TPA: TraR/DksA C4-type zinc finger protein [Gammaproteobacteria bacterium]|jgi:RNA polymerase-binding transcription factor DksA